MIDKELLGQALIMRTGTFLYQKGKKGYKTYCCICGKHKVIKNDELKQIRTAKLCPNCFNDVMIKKDKAIYRQYVFDDNTGYYAAAVKEIGKSIKVYLDVVAETKGNKIRTRHCHSAMQYLIYDGESEWTRWRVNRIGWHFTDINWIYGREYEIRDKRAYLEDFKWNYKLKSNQMEIVKNNLLNKQQIDYLYAFDLKSYEDIYKYRRYINKDYRWYGSNRPDTDIVLNVYYLDYLYRNNIPLSEYYHYYHNCLFVGQKPDKPKDFKYRHEQLSNYISNLKELERFKKSKLSIKKRYKELINNALLSGKWQIKPFKTPEEVKQVAKTLHNCICSNYLMPYAKGETDIYYMTENDQIVVAIEVCKNELEQAYQDHNELCTKEQMSVIKKWCKANGFGVGEYA